MEKLEVNEPRLSSSYPEISELSDSFSAASESQKLLVPEPPSLSIQHPRLQSAVGVLIKYAQEQGVLENVTSNRNNMVKIKGTDFALLCDDEGFYHLQDVGLAGPRETSSSVVFKKTSDAFLLHSLPDTQTQQVIIETANQMEAKQSSEKAAAKKIQRAYRSHLSQELKIDRKSRKIIDKEMQRVCQVIENSYTAAIVNLASNQELDNLGSTIRFIREMGFCSKTELYKSAVLFGVGNCGECAELLYYLLQANSELSADLKKKIKVATVDDHVFVIIGDSDSEESVVVDPWLKYVDLKKQDGFRPKPVLAKERSRGFLGTVAQYRVFLNNHEDGTYIKKGSKHQIYIPYDPSTYSRTVEQETVLEELEQRLQMEVSKIVSETLANKTVAP